VIAAYIAAGAVFLAFATWTLYLAVMMLKQKRDTLPPFAKACGMGVLWIGYLFDVAFNIMASIAFLEPPRELLFTARVSRHINEPGYRGNLSRWFCSNLLDPFDPGHCK
jgi:hypothetical protein